MAAISTTYCRLLCLLLWLQLCSCGVQRKVLSPGFKASEMNYIDNDGFFLLSNSSTFAFGFVTYSVTDSTSFLLSIIHLGTSRTVWTANRDAPISHSDNFVFSEDGNAYIQSADKIVWSSNTSNSRASSILLRDSGNLIIADGNDGSKILWQSFDHPTDTLVSGQSFVEGMKLVSNKSGGGNLIYELSINSGDLLLYAGFPTPQPYWSVLKEKRIINNKAEGAVHSAMLVSNSWNFYDSKQYLLMKFIVGPDDKSNSTLAAVLGPDGLISFYSLQDDSTNSKLPTAVPDNPCSTPEPCDPYYICSNSGSIQCRCPAVLSSDSNCNPDIVSPCSTGSSDSFKLLKVEDGVGYFATSFASPFAKMNATGCRDACLGNCSCLALFFDADAGNCFLFSQIGSLQQLSENSKNYVSYIKVSGRGDGSGTDGGGKKNLETVIIVVISLATAVVIAALIFTALVIHRRRRRKSLETSEGSSGEDEFLDGIAGMPIRFSYRDLQEATENFAVKLGQGGFGSVYLGKLPDGASIAVKKLEGIGQGKKEFRAEVSIIGSIHHVHLVRLRGFCAEGTHRLLAYEYMAKGSLDRWIFKARSEDDFQLDWDKRFNIALGTAKGLAYLHEDCESKIVHCDIKPENVLLDDNFVAKVSDFGLAKLMTREQSHVFTTLRGTRGYLAPEWITNYAISEKSDVYSYGMVLLEIIGGRKNYDPSESSEKSHFPSYAFKKLEEGKLREVCDLKLKYDDKDERVERAIKVALWCIQEDMSLRPPMTKVAQLLEGVMDVPEPPTSSQMGFRLYASFFKTMSEEGTSSGLSDYNSDALLSAVRLSGPR